MKRIAAVLVVAGFMMITLALPVWAVNHEETAEETGEILLTEDASVIEIEEEDVPLAGLPGLYRSDVSKVLMIAGTGMIVIAGVILISGIHRERKQYSQH